MEDMHQGAHKDRVPGFGSRGHLMAALCAMQITSASADKKQWTTEDMFLIWVNPHHKKVSGMRQRMPAMNVSAWFVGYWIWVDVWF
jgi:hypothetical protein